MMTKWTGTYARLLLSDWHPLVKIITGSDTPELSKEDIQRVLEGPLAEFFREKIQAYAKIMEDAHRLSFSGEEAFKSLVDANKPLKSGAEIDKDLMKLSEITERHYQELLNAWVKFSQNLIQKLAEKKMVLNSIESEDLSRQEPLAAIYKRYQDLHLEVPKLKSSTMNLEYYLYLKTYLAVQSFLSRQHLPHESADILRILKQLKKEFQAIAQNEKALYKQQKMELGI